MSEYLYPISVLIQCSSQSLFQTYDNSDLIDLGLAFDLRVSLALVSRSRIMLTPLMKPWFPELPPKQIKLSKKKKTYFEKRVGALQALLDNLCMISRLQYFYRIVLFRFNN